MKWLKRIVAVLVILIVAFGALYTWSNWDWWFGTQKQELSATFFCSSQRVHRNIECDEDYLFMNHLDALTTCVERYGTPAVSNSNSTWITCLETYGVTQYTG